MLWQGSRLPIMQAQYKIMDWMILPMFLFGTVKRT